MWPGDVVVINGHPRHSQSYRDLVEKDHLVELQLQAMKFEWKGRGNIPWSYTGIINLVWLLTCSFLRSVYKQYRHIQNIKKINAQCNL